MRIIVQGVSIELTVEQIAAIDKEKRKREKCRKSFEKILFHFGFKKINTTGWQNPKQFCYEQKEYGWFAEIQNFGIYSEVFMIGKGLQNNHPPPGGHMYGEPEDIEKEIVKALDNLQNTNQDG